MKGRLLIYGAGGHGKVVADAVSCLADYEFAGFVDDDPSRVGAAFFGYTILGTRSDLRRLYEGGIDWAVPAVGDNEVRVCLLHALQEAGFNIAVIVHRSAVLAASVQLGLGTFVAAGATINPACKIGQGCIINTGATVDHDCQIDDGVHIAPGVNLCGYVHVGELTLVGVGASVLPGVRIGRRCRVGGGAAVTENVADGMTVVGVPARAVSQ
jgi:sugar O-acyltransferase (sialic acid O-acetyltransferase NeuD family)